MPALNLRRLSCYRWPLVLTLAVVVTAAFSLSPLVDVARGAAPISATLRTPLLYDLLAPASNVLDALTLLSPAQYWAAFALFALAFLVPRTAREVRNGGFAPRKTLRSVLRLMGGSMALIGIMLVATRPMASLQLSDPDFLAVDFHSHTEASHDGRAAFSAERNREWHNSSGFDAVYVTDHRTFDGALSGMERNPARAGDETVLLPGVELRNQDEHVILIGVDPKRMQITSPDWQGAAVAADGGPVPPILLLAMPGNIVRIPPNESTGPIRLAGIEASDGSPRGLAQSASDRNGILALAGNLQLALVSGSDNHGWGRTAPAWSVLRIPDWRSMTPTELELAIRRTIITRGPSSVQVIARRTAPPPSRRIEIVFGGLAVGLLMMRTMNLRERFSWIAWGWGAGFLSLTGARRRRQRFRTRLREKLKKRARRPLIDAAAAMGAALYSYLRSSAPPSVETGDAGASA